jgi:uncharacterized protein YggU (UPF0235/DUF167 family)
MKFSVSVKTGSPHAKIEKSPNGYMAYVKEHPIENRANKALIKLVSEYFGVPKSQVIILSGMKSKKKLVEIRNSQTG